MLDFDSKDIDSMDADAGDDQEPAPIGHWKATSSYDIYMVDTPKEGDGDGTAGDDPSKKQPKHRRQRRRSKSRQSKNGDSGIGDNNTPDSAEEHPLQQDSAPEDGEASPHEGAADKEVEDDNYMPPSEDEASLDDDEFVVPEDPVEQEHFQRRLMATASSLKKKQQQLRADQDLLADRWTEVLAAKEYELECPSKSYPKRRSLPRLEEEAPKPTSPAHDTADRPPRGRDREASRPSTQAAPGAAQDIPRHRKMRQTCEIYWRTRQGKQDRSTDRAGAPRYVTVIVTPDNTIDKAHLSCVVI